MGGCADSHRRCDGLSIDIRSSSDGARPRLIAVSVSVGQHIGRHLMLYSTISIILISMAHSWENLASIPDVSNLDDSLLQRKMTADLPEDEEATGKLGVMLSNCMQILIYTSGWQSTDSLMCS